MVPTKMGPFDPDGKIPARVADEVKREGKFAFTRPRLMLWVKRKERLPSFRKRRKDPNAERRGKAKNVKT